MPEDGETLALVVGDPVELDYAALADKRQMAVPGMIGAQEGDQRAAGSRRLGGEILNACLLYTSRCV